MAKIKLNSERKIITINNKISCSCCGPECCFYTAPRANVNKIPESIQFYGQVLNKTGNGYGDQQNGTFLEGDVWASYRNGIRSERTCLFTQANIAPGDFGQNNDKNIVDNWADAYGTQTDASAGGVCQAGFVQGIVYRTHSWLWSGSTECGKLVYVFYFPCTQGIPPNFGYNTSPSWELVYEYCCDSSPGGPPGNSSGPILQSGPVGDYNGNRFVYEI